MTRAIKFIFNQHGWKAGKYSIAYQSCDDATAQAGKWDSGKCSANANAYAQDSSVVGVIGTFNSGCAEIIDPGAQPRAERPRRDGQPGEHLRRPDARRARARSPVSRASTTRPASATTRASWRRTTIQGAADATAREVARRQEGVHPERQGGLRPRRRDELPERCDEARHQGRRLHRVGRRRRRRTRRSHVKIKASGAQGVFLGGLICENGGKLIKDIRAGAPSVKIMTARRVHARLGDGAGVPARQRRACTSRSPVSRTRRSRAPVRRS